MRVHLRVHETGNLALVEPQHLPDVLLGQVAAEMRDSLPREVVEQVRLLVVGNVVEVD